MNEWIYDCEFGKQHGVFCLVFIGEVRAIGVSEKRSSIGGVYIDVTGYGGDWADD